MKYVVCAVVLLILLVEAMAAVPYPPPLDRNLSEDYNENLENVLMRTDKRACVRRGSSCDGKPQACCDGSSCRCNLWGTNCRCERAGRVPTLHLNMNDCSAVSNKWNYYVDSGFSLAYST